MAMITALVGAGTNVILNLILIPKIGAIGAAIATVVAFIVVFVSRAIHTRKYIKVDLNPPLLALQTSILIAQCCVMLKLKNGMVMYGIEAVLFVVMLIVNIKPIKELFELIITRFLKRSPKKNN